MRISDWSSDVCSSDLTAPLPSQSTKPIMNVPFPEGLLGRAVILAAVPTVQLALLRDPAHQNATLHRSPSRRSDSKRDAEQALTQRRSEERRVGKECVRTCKSWG